jgi:hypothetical protein
LPGLLCHAIGFGRLGKTTSVVRDSCAEHHGVERVSRVDYLDERPERLRVGHGQAVQIRPIAKGTDYPPVPGTNAVAR